MADVAQPPAQTPQQVYSEAFEKYLKQLQGAAYKPPEQRVAANQGAKGKSGGSSSGTAIASGALVLASAYARQKLAQYVASQAAGNAAASTATTAAPAALSTPNVVAVNSVGGANAGATAAAPEAAGTPYASVGSPSYAGYIGAALQGVNAARNWDDVEDERKATYAQQQAALAVANVYTAGLAGLAEGAARKYAPGFMSSLDKLDQKYNPMTVGLNSLGVFGTKSAEQQRRDKVRDYLVKQGVVKGGDDYNLRFSDNTSFDIGKDGGARLQNMGTNIDGKTERQYSDVDFSNPISGSVVGAVNPLAAILTGGNDRLKSDFAGEYTNAVLNSPGDTNAYQQRVLDLYRKHNLDQTSALQQIDQLKDVDDATKAAYRNGVGTVFAGTAIPGSSPSPLASAAKTLAVPYQAPLRSKTRSPGIDKNGKRISYGR